MGESRGSKGLGNYYDCRRIPTRHLTTISEKGTIKMVELSNNFVKNFWFIFNQMLNEKNL